MPNNRTNQLPEKSLLELFKEYISECEHTTCLRKATTVGYAAAFELFSKMIPEGTDVQSLTVTTLNEFFKRIRTRERIVGRDTKRIGIKDSTIKTYASKLNTFFEWLVRREIILENPLNRMTIRRPEYTDSRALENEDVRKIYAAITLRSKNPLILRRDTVMVSILVFCGLRKGEFISLRVTDIDMDKRTLTVRGETSKSKRVRILPIHPTLFLHLKEYFSERNKRNYRTEALIVSAESDRGLSRHGLKHWVNKLIRHSGVKFHLHRFRHTFASNLGEMDVGFVKIQKLMGHSDPKMTMTYLRSISTEEMREDINKLCL